MGLRDANSTEMNPSCENPVVIDMPEHNPGRMGGTMRLGRKTTIFQTTQRSSVLSALSVNNITIIFLNTACYLNPYLCV